MTKDADTCSERPQGPDVDLHKLQGVDIVFVPSANLAILHPRWLDLKYFVEPLVRQHDSPGTILHALHHNGKMRDGLSRHYYNMLMLDRAEITATALADSALLEQVVCNKSVIFADASASYVTAVLGTLQLTPFAPIRPALASDYAGMADIFMVAPPAFAELLEGLADLEARINQAGSAN